VATLTVGVNSWCTIAFADDYFDERWGTSAWAALTNNQKTVLLIHAYNWINQQPDISIPASSTTTIVKQAQCEVAWYIYSYFDSHEKRRALYIQGVTKFKISKFSEDLQGASFPEFVKGMLKDFITEIGGQFPIIEREFENNS
jgi:hypothetical protein